MLAKEIATALARLGPSDRFYMQASSPLPRRSFLAEARKGSFPAFKIGKIICARREDVDAFVEAHPLRRRAQTGSLSDLETVPLLERSGLRCGKAV